MRRDMPKLIELYMQRTLKIDELVSRRIKLDDVNAAFDRDGKGRGRALGDRVLADQPRDHVGGAPGPVA